MVAHDDTTCEVLWMSGLPASGKDTWLRASHPELPVISLDQLGTHLEIESWAPAPARPTWPPTADPRALVKS